MSNVAHGSKIQLFHEISDTHDNEYSNYCLLGCDTMYFDRHTDTKPAVSSSGWMEATVSPSKMICIYLLHASHPT
jgi:hypothetical protein